MSRIAQKLCDEIVEPALNSSRSNSVAINSSKFMYQIPDKEEAKTTRSVVIEKRKVINKLLPDESGTCKNVRRLQSKETISRKKYVDIGSNTFITGPLRCDNNCVTLVRRRENRCNCKVPQRRSKVKVNAKQIQTRDWKNFSYLDKACAQRVETVSCGTQFYEIYSNELRMPNSTRTIIPPIREVKPWRNTTSFMRESPNVRRDFSSTINQPSSLSHYYMSGKRWALSQYPTRGPDF